MPSYKVDSESESENELPEKVYSQEHSDDDGEPGPDDTFHFRQSFSKGQRGYPQHYNHAPPLDEDMNEDSYQTYDYDNDEEEEEDQLYDDEMQEDFITEEEDQSDFSEDLEDELQELDDPLAAAVRIEKRPTWLEQIEYTDRAIQRLRAVAQRERLVNSKVHWGGQLPELKYSPEDLERDLFGESAKVELSFYGTDCSRRENRD